MAPEQVLGTRMKGPGVSLVQSPKRRSAMALSFAAVGALSFWLPDIAIQAHAGPNLDSRHAWAITLFAPAVFLLAYVVARNFALKTKFNRLGPTMLLGVWVSGGLFMTISALVSGNDFIGGTGLWRLAIIPMSIVPIVHIHTSVVRRQFIRFAGNHIGRPADLWRSCQSNAVEFQRYPQHCGSNAERNRGA